MANVTKYGVYHPTFERWAGTKYDWTCLTNDDVILFHSQDAAETFRKAVIWEPEAVVQEVVVSLDKAHN